QTAQRFTRFLADGDTRRVHVIGHVMHEGAVLVDEHRGLHCSRPHGQEVSRIGRIMTSGMTVAPPTFSTPAIASATSAGSCSTSGSISGKRSNRNGVRIPPATTAVTLMPCGRSSACSACDRPSRPHLLAWYAEALGRARLAAVEAMFTTCPTPRSRIGGAPDFDSWKAPRGLVC